MLDNRRAIAGEAAGNRPRRVNRHDHLMAVKLRPSDIGTERGRALLAATGREIRAARVDRGLSLAAVGAAAGLSASEVSRIERGLVPGAAVVVVARLHAVVGLELGVRSFPGAGPIRDGAHVALLDDFRALLHPSLAWATEVPLPSPGDLRSWDGVVRGVDWRRGVEAETAPRDGQALARRIQLKERDGGVDGVILVLRATVQTRRFLREAGGLLASVFPVPGKRALALLGAGLDPGGNTIIVVPRRPRG